MINASALRVFAPVALAMLALALGVIVRAETGARATSGGIANIAAFLDQCPTDDPAYAQIRADFELRREGVPVGVIACSEPVSLMPVSVYTDELITLQALRVIYYMEGGRSVAYPWTGGSLYDWLKAQIGGINITAGGSSCCDVFGGRWFIRLGAQNQWDRDDARYWPGLSLRIPLIAHEARHVDGFPHVGGCPLFPSGAGGCDETYDEGDLSPYGIGWWLNARWLSGEIDVGFACLHALVRTQYGEWHVDEANSLRGRFVSSPPPLLTLPPEPGGVCRGASATPGPTPTVLPTPTPGPTLTPDPTLTPTPTVTAGPTATVAASPTAAPATVSASPSPTPTPVPSAPPSPEPTATQGVSAMPTPLEPTTLPPTPAVTPGATVRPATPEPTTVAPPPPAPTLTPGSRPTPAAGPADANCDGVLDARDGLAVLRRIGGVGEHGGCPPSGATGAEPPMGDVNCDGRLDAGDAVALLRLLARLAAAGPCA